VAELTYKEAGVDTAEGARAVEGIRSHVRSTYRPEVIGDIGGFGGLFSAAALKGMEDPVLVSGTDGVGTKIRLAQLLDKHDTVGIDLVAMCANDILVTGAEPLFFLDYLAIGKLDSALVEQVVAGIAEGCRQAGCSLIGGEMAEHPGTMEPDDYDLSGFCVGAVDRPKMIDGSQVAEGDVILGLASSGVHSNGFSLVRRALIENQPDQREALMARPDSLGGRTLGEALLAPTRIYAAQVKALLEGGVAIKAMAHITGGGITENLDRILPKSMDAQVTRGGWSVPAVIETVIDAAQLSDDQAYKTFNMGIGYALVVSPDQVEAARALLDEEVYEIGTVVPGTGVVVYQ
jgi:phosphoribosylformylglycinamidine cyclo-ligase